MFIQSIEIFHVVSPLVTPFRTAFDDTTTAESVLVRLSDGQNEGWGEGAPWGAPFFSSEWAGGAFAFLRDHAAPRVVGQNLESGAQLQELLRPYKGNYFAKSALDLAWWDLAAKNAHQPLWQFLGGKTGVAPVGADFGVADSIGELLGLIAGSQEEGAPRVKLKIRHGWDVDVLREVRREFPDVVFHVDANSGYTLDDARIFQELDEFNLAFFEQPLAHDDLLDHAKLAKIVKTPICLDESITSGHKARKAIEIGACQLINIKPGRVGGTTVGLEILQTAKNAGIACWIGGMLESAVGAMHCVAMGTLDGIVYPCDIFPSARFYAQDLGTRDLKFHEPGQIAAFEGNGVGVTPDAQRLKAQTRQQAVLRAP